MSSYCVNVARHSVCRYDLAQKILAWPDLNDSRLPEAPQPSFKSRPVDRGTVGEAFGWWRLALSSTHMCVAHIYVYTDRDRCRCVCIHAYKYR